MRQILVLLALVMLVASCTTKNDSTNSLLNEPVTHYRVRSSNNVEWSPDNSKVLMETSQDSTLYLTLFDVETNQADNLYAASDYGLLSYDWNPVNSNEFVMTEIHPNSIIFFIGNLETNELKRIGQGYASQWLADGTGILIRRDEQYFIYDIESNVYDLQSDAISMSVAPDYVKDSFNLASYLHYNSEETRLIIQTMDGMSGQTEISGTNGSGIWSPDGRNIATKSYVTSPHDYILSVFTINGELVLETQADQETSISWSPRGEYLVTDNWDAEIFILDIEQQAETLIANGYSPSWSPDGNQIAFIDAENRTLQFFDTSSLFNN